MPKTSSRGNPKGKPPAEVSPCSNCGGGNLYSSKVSAGGGYAPNYLPRLGTWWAAAKFDVVVCGDCGLARFFADEQATGKLPGAKAWKRVRATEDY